MKKLSCTIACLTLTAGASLAVAAGPTTITADNTTLSGQVKLQAKAYTVADVDGNGVVRITADNTVVDFSGATLAATPGPDRNLAKAEGIGILVEGAKNVTIRNARVHGYAFNILARNAPGLTLEGCDVSFSKAQQIAAGEQPIEIWLVLRDLNAWRSYGAGCWLEKCDGASVRKCRGTGAQNGLLLIDSRKCTVVECDFSFNSGFGIGLWGTCESTVAWNLIDFVNRPWGGGWGGDSAALVLTGGSNDNDLVGNSMTHGGDGLFLTDRLNGGLNDQTKTSNFEGRCDRNLIAHNDGSWSTANAFEGTFSFGNIYYRNLACDSNFGFWLGFSCDSLLAGNQCSRNNNDGIAIEHGKGNRIEGNTFEDNRGAAVALWAGGAEWVRQLHPSADIDIRDNTIRRCGRAFRLEGSTQVSAGGNTIEAAANPPFEFTDRPATGALAAFKASESAKRLEKLLAMRPAGFQFLHEGQGPRGIEWLQPDRFAPRDYRGGLVAWRKLDAASLELWPLVEGELRFTAPEWVQVRKDDKTGHHIASVKAATGPGEQRDFAIEVQGAGGKKQSLKGSFLTAQWDVRWYRWDQPPLTYDDVEGWKRLFASPPIHRQTSGLLSSALWEKGRPQGVPPGHFALVAASKIKLPAGRYRLASISDDGLRVFVDGREAISRWNHHGPTPDSAEVDLAAGVHEFVVHYCQESGASALNFTWQRLADER